jgi:DNA primase
VLLPDGMDPDDVVRLRGADTMREMLAGARPLVDLLWMREVDAEPLDTPERKAGFEARLMNAVAQIKHQGVRKAYERELRDRLYWHSRGTRGQAGGQSQAGGQPAARKGISPGPTALAGLRLVVRALESPQIMEQGREVLFRAVFPDADVALIRDAAFYVYDNTEMLDRHGVAAHLRSLGRKRAVELLETFPVGQPMDPRSNEGRDWLDAIGRFPVARTLVAEVEATIRADGEGVELMSAAHQARIMQKVIARRSASRSVVDETVTSPAQDGVQELRDALGGMGAAMESKRSED